MKSNSLNKQNGPDINKFSIYFTKFVVYSLFILFLIVFSTTFSSVYHNFKDINYVNIILIGIYLILTGGFIYGIRKKISKKKMFYAILISGFILRLTWALVTKSTPISDFKTIYDSATNLLAGDNSSFVGLGYFARFPHMTPYVLLFSLIGNLPLKCR